MIEEQKGAAEAEQLLEDLGFDTLPIVPSEVAESINCEDFRLVLETIDFDTDRILGKAHGNDKGALIYVNRNIPDQRRSNFTAAHEIGHVCLHIMPQKKLTFECGSKELNSSFDDPIEKEANGFASGLLMPKSLITRQVDSNVNWRNISRISEICDASLEAVYRRISHLGNVPSAMVIHKNGKFKRFVASTNFNFYIEQSSLSAYQLELAVDIKEEAYPSDFETVDASDWVNPKSKGVTLESIYASTVLLNEGFTYTILTYDDDCLAEDEDYY